MTPDPIADSLREAWDNLSLYNRLRITSILVRARHGGKLNMLGYVFTLLCLGVTIDDTIGQTSAAADLLVSLCALSLASLVLYYAIFFYVLFTRRDNIATHKGLR